VTRKTADRKGATARLRSVGATCLLGALVSFPAHAFEIEEATIQDVHRAIQAGETTCTQIVTAYIERAKAYNGICTALVTQDGKPVAAAKGPMRTGAQLRFPTKTVPVTGVLPDFDQYKGLPIEYGRMETTISDPTVKQQYGMRVGIANAGQLNALETVNIRGERSVSCKARCDLHPSKGPLPASCPKACDEFRKQPDALERAAELDKQYGTKPDLKKLPMYCVAFSWKNWYDAKDMRATGGNDINYAMDAPKYDSPDVANLRAKGAISFAVATASSTGMSSNGPNKATTVIPSNSFQDAAWGGQACNPYDTERVPRGTSNGSGVSVSANLAQCSICEQTSASCKGPASRNNVVNLLPTKGITQDGGPGYSYSGDRAGIHCRTVADAALVLDAIKGFDTEDMFTAIPKGLIPKEPYASVVVGSSDVTAKPMTGMRIGVVREFMVKHTKNDAAISDQIDNEIKTALRDKLGAELIESVDPMYADDSSIPNMKYTFQDAFREVLPHNAPEFFFQKDSRGALEFAVPGWDVTSADYQLALALGKAPLSEKLTLRRIAGGASDPEGLFVINKYLAQRGDERVKDWASWVANSKWKSDAQRAGAENALLETDPRERAGSISALKMQSVLRMIVLKVMYENGIDAFVNPENTLPPFKLGGPAEPTVNDRGVASCCQRFTAMLGGPEIDVPAGYTRTVFEPTYVLNADKTRYETATGTVQSQLPNAMPISLMVWGGPGFDSDVIKVASAYEAATKHRVPPPSFGPVRRAVANK
jgi:amidase